MAFLSCQRFALAGASRKAGKFGNVLLKELAARGRSVVPVHPEAALIDGQACVPCLAGLPSPVEGLVVCLPPKRVPPLLEEAALAGIGNVWLQQGSSSPAALETGRRLGLSLVAGQCLLMHLEPVKGVHALHRWMWRLVGK